MIATYEHKGAKYVQVSTKMSAEDWHYLQLAFLDVTTDLMNERLTSNGKNGLANLIQLLKDLMLDESQTAEAIEG